MTLIVVSSGRSYVVNRRLQLHALAAPANRQAVLAGARVDHAVVVHATEWAFHIRTTIHAAAAYGAEEAGSTDARSIVVGRCVEFVHASEAPCSMLAPWTTPNRCRQSTCMSHFGILNVNKPAGCTSRDVVDRVERLVRPAKAGHAGTLDPLATGVLVICVGQATRLIQYVQRMPKALPGHVSARPAQRNGRRRGRSRPVGGSTAADRARCSTLRCRNSSATSSSGRPPTRPSKSPAAGRTSWPGRARRSNSRRERSRSIDLAVRRYEYPELELDIECGSGTYVRSLGRDLAAALGTGAVMSALERTAIGAFRVEDAVALDDLDARIAGRNICNRRSTAVADLPRVELSEAAARRNSPRPADSRRRPTSKPAATADNRRMGRPRRRRPTRRHPRRKAAGRTLAGVQLPTLTCGKTLAAADSIRRRTICTGFAV